VKAAIEQLAREEGLSMNQFVATAVAEKLTAMRMASFFAQRQSKGDFDAFANLLKRSGGELPRTGDELDAV
jgi:hypothetical protein